MECTLTQPELLPYHFGEVDDDARLRVERHLATCARCLAELFALKRALETSGPTPSAAAKARLRAAVARAVARPERRAAWSWWERPLAVACAAAAVVLATAATVSLAASPGAPPHGWTASRNP